MTELALTAEVTIDPSTAEIMGVLNVTPDSFSDGGTLDSDTPEARTASALERAYRLVAQGATIIDVGGESTRPGAERVPQEEEQARVLPVVRQLVRDGIAVSVDTMYADTAAACLDLDDRMLALVAERGARYILSHWRGHSVVMNDLAEYDDAAAEIIGELTEMRDRAVAAGIARDRIILDPGLGFAKDRDDNWAVLNQLPKLQGLGHPVLIGVSRKRFVGDLLPAEAPVTARDLPTAVLSALCVERGVWGVRVHNVAATKVAIDTVAAWQNGADLRGEADAR
jgi:dihydropteroate synthase